MFSLYNNGFGISHKTIYFYPPISIVHLIIVQQPCDKQCSSQVLTRLLHYCLIYYQVDYLRLPPFVETALETPKDFYCQLLQRSGCQVDGGPSKNTIIHGR